MHTTPLASLKPRVCVSGIEFVRYEASTIFLRTLSSTRSRDSNERTVPSGATSCIGKKRTRPEGNRRSRITRWK